MSMSPLPWTSVSTIEPIKIRVQRRRRGLPTTIFVTLRSCANARMASLIFWPGRLTVSAPSGSAQRELAQGDEVALAKEVPDGLLRLVGHVDLAVPEALEQIVGRQVDQLDLVGLLEDRVRHRLAHDDPGDLRDDVVEALDVLDVHGRIDVDAGVEELDHVLPPFGVARARRVGMRQLVDEDQGGTASERAVEGEFGQRGGAG